MNSINSTQTFQFSGNDGLFIGFQVLIFFLSLLALLLLLIFRKKKPLKLRGISPYISIFGMWPFMIRLYFQSADGFKPQYPDSITHKFLHLFFNFLFSISCWFTLLSLSPISVLFTVVQTMTIVQYFAQERLNAWKDVSWDILNKKSKEMKEKELVHLESKEPEVLEEKGNAEQPIKDEDEKTSNLTQTGNDQTSVITHNSSLTPEDRKKMKIMFVKIKFARFLVSDVFKVFFVFICYIVISTILKQVFYNISCWVGRYC
jgi:hypothetical protein